MTIGRDARARALQLPAWNEALGLPRPWDQQWSLRIQQILAYETDLLEYPDIFEGSKVMDGLVAELVEGARAEMAVVAEHGGAVEAVSYMKTQLVESHRARVAAIESGEHKVVGQNVYTSTEPSPLQEGDGRRHPHTWTRPWSRGRSTRWRSGPMQRDQAAVDAALEALASRGARRVREHHARHPRRRRRRRHHRRVGRRAARGVRRVPRSHGRRPTPPRRPTTTRSSELRDKVERVSEKLGRRLKILVGKPGLDGHSNGAEQIAVRARDAGMDVVYEGIRLTPARIAQAAVQEGVHVVGLSILSGSHLELIPSVLAELRDAGVDVPWWWAGSSPRPTPQKLREAGVAARLHAEGLRDQPHHGRHRGSRGGAQRRGSRAGRGVVRLLTGRRSAAGSGRGDRSAAPAALNLIEDRSARWTRACRG